MTVFKNYFKIVARYKWLILLYTGICIGISILNMSSGGNAPEQFMENKPNIAIINNDEETVLIKGFTQYITEKSEIVELENNEEKIQDALFYREVDYVLYIPENYTQDFINKKEPQIEIKKTAEGSAQYTQMMVSKYIKLADIYNRAGMNEQKIVDSIKSDLEKQVDIVIENESNTKSMAIPSLYYNFANYSFLAISIYIIAIVMSVFNNQMIKKKNSICKMPYKKISNQLFLGNVILILGVWVVYVLISLILCKEAMLTMNGLLLMLNSFIFIITAASIGFLVSSLVKNKDAISGIVNVVALGLSFISGCFAPQQWLNSTVLTVAKFFPSYWYIKANTEIIELTSYGFEDIKSILTSISIIFGFGVLYVFIIGIINKIKLHKK